MVKPNSEFGNVTSDIVPSATVWWNNQCRFTGGSCGCCAWCVCVCVCAWETRNTCHIHVSGAAAMPWLGNYSKVRGLYFWGGSLCLLCYYPPPSIISAPLGLSYTWSWNKSPLEKVPHSKLITVQYGADQAAPVLLCLIGMRLITSFNRKQPLKSKNFYCNPANQSNFITSVHHYVLTVWRLWSFSTGNSEVSHCIEVTGQWSPVAVACYVQ